MCGSGRRRAGRHVPAASLFKRGEQAEALAEWTHAVHYRVMAGHVERAVTLLPARLEAGDHELAREHAQRLVELLDTAPDCPAFDPVVLERPSRQLTGTPCRTHERRRGPLCVSP